MRNQWTKEQEAELISLFPTTSLKDLAVLMNLSYSSVISKCLKLKLKKSSEYRKAYLAINREEARKVQLGSEPWNKKPKVSLRCKWCKQEFKVASYRGDKALFCNRTCMAAWRKTIVGEAHWLDTKVECTCKWCGSKFRVKKAKVGYGEGIYCSKRCVGSFTAFELSQHKAPTSIELKVQNCLTENGIDFIAQYKIGPWCVDAFIPEQNLVIECDGDYWHSLPKVKIRDKQKNSYLKREGYGVLRITEKQINENVKLALAPLFQS